MIKAYRQQSGVKNKLKSRKKNANTGFCLVSIWCYMKMYNDPINVHFVDESRRQTTNFLLQ